MKPSTSIALADIPTDRQAASAGRFRIGRLSIASLLFVMASLAAMPVDLMVSRLLFQQHSLPGDLSRLITLSEVFAHGMGVAMILIAVWTLDRPGRRRLFRIAVMAYGAGLTANLLKLTVARTRPHSFDFSMDVWSTFGPLFPWLNTETTYGHAVQSFPSAHTATAVGLAIALGWGYRRGAWLFAVFALLASLQRISSGAHFLSDVFLGAAIGCLVGAVCLSKRGVGAVFDRIEA